MNINIDKLRETLLSQLKVLSTKIETNEPFPENEQTVEDLVAIQERIEECLNCWYY